MSDKTYRLVISDDVDTYAYAHGTTNIIGYVVRELDLNPEFTYEVSLTETSALAGENVRTVLAITADGDTVVTLLKGKVSKERKAAKAASVESTPEETSAENETAEQDQPEPAFA